MGKVTGLKSVRVEDLNDSEHVKVTFELEDSMMRAFCLTRRELFEAMEEHASDYNYSGGFDLD